MPAANLTHMGSGSAMEWSETLLQGGVPTYLLAVAVFFTALAIRFHDRWIFSHSRPEIPTAPGAWPIIGNTMWFMSLAARKTRMLDETLRLQKSVGKGGKPFTCELRSNEKRALQVEIAERSHVFLLCFPFSS